MKYTNFAFILFLISLIGVGGDVSAQKLSGNVTISMLADVAAVKPGESFRVGVLFKILSPWHIYWKNPGQAGLPTRIKFSGTEGLEFGELQWPEPIRFTQPGNLLGVGYLNEVLLFSEVKVSDKIGVGTELTIDAEVKWLECHDKCVPGKDTISMSLPTKGVSEQSNQEIYRSWIEKVKPFEM